MTRRVAPRLLDAASTFAPEDRGEGSELIGARGHPRTLWEGSREPSDEREMDGAEPLQNAATADLSAAARTSTDARLRGVLLALASLYRNVGFADAARIWRVDPATLHRALQRFEEAGLDGLSDGVAFGRSTTATSHARRLSPPPDGKPSRSGPGRVSGG